MRSNTRLFLLAGLLLALALALLVSPFASSSPDGLEAVAAREGFADAAKDPAIEGPLADYTVAGVEEPKVSSGLSGAVGVLLTFGLGIALFAGLRVLRPDEPRPNIPEA